VHLVLINGEFTWSLSVGMPGSALSSLSDASAPDESGSGASSSFADDETALADIACADSESAHDSDFSSG